MAEINKLSVGQALDKLRGNMPESKRARLDKTMDALEEDIQRMRTARFRLERDQQAAESKVRNAQQPNNKKGPLSIPRWLVVLAVIGPLLLTLVIFYRALVRWQ